MNNEFCLFLILLVNCKFFLLELIDFGIPHRLFELGKLIFNIFAFLLSFTHHFLEVNYHRIFVLRLAVSSNSSTTSSSSQTDLLKFISFLFLSFEDCYFGLKSNIFLNHLVERCLELKCFIVESLLIMRNAFGKEAWEIVTGWYNVEKFFIVLQMWTGVLLELTIFVAVLSPVVLCLGWLRSEYIEEYLFIVNYLI